jgi:hypothetical protein
MMALCKRLQMSSALPAGREKPPQIAAASIILCDII